MRPITILYSHSALKIIICRSLGNQEFLTFFTDITNTSFGIVNPPSPQCTVRLHELETAVAICFKLSKTVFCTGNIHMHTLSPPWPLIDCYESNEFKWFYVIWWIFDGIIYFSHSRYLMYLLTYIWTSNVPKMYVCKSHIGMLVYTKLKKHYTQWSIID